MHKAKRLSDLLTVTQSQFEEIRSAHNLNKELIDDNIKKILYWYQLQPHLPKIELDKDWIERILILNKGSVEKAKRTVDWTFASKDAFPEFFSNRDPIALIDRAEKTVLPIILPKLSKDNTRIVYIRNRNPDSTDFDLTEYFKLIFMINEYRQHTDYSLGDRYILDIQNLTFSHLVKVNPALVKKANVVNRNVIGVRIASLHILNPSSIAENILQILRPVLSEKMNSRIHVHHNYEELYDHISQEVLPSDLGGDEKDVMTLCADWKAFMASADFQAWIKRQGELKSDETKRPADCIMDDMLGCSGTFRKLSLD